MKPHFRFLLLFLLILGYSGFPWPEGKFFCLGLFFFYLLKWIQNFAFPLLVGISSLFYTFAFLLNPVHFFYRPFSDPLWGPYFFWGTTISFILGLIWLFWITSQKASSHKMASLRQWKFSFPLGIGWLGILGVLYFPSWSADLAYLGDEVFHMISIQTYWWLLLVLLEESVSWILLCVWIALGILILSFPKHFSRKFLGGWGILFLVLGLGFSVGFYSVDILKMNPFLLDRVARYPATQPWISAILGGICWEYNRQTWIFSYEINRLLPLLALAGLGFIFMAPVQFQRFPLKSQLLALASLASIPILRYHGTLLYLELPLIALLSAILLEGNAWLKLPVKKLSRHFCWWAILWLIFFKETAVPAILLLCGARWIYQFFLKRQPFRKILVSESILNLGILLPVLLYLGIRFYFQQRPYGAEFSNLWNLKLWGRSFYHLSYQIGGFWIFVIYGFARFVATKQRSRTFLLLSFLGGMHCFLLADTALHIGLARFNLLLLPPILVAGWEGFCSLQKNYPRVTTLALLLVLGANLFFAPIEFTGARKNWGKSDEQWYPYTLCLKEIYRQNPRTRILLGNMILPYGTSVITHQWHWNPPQLAQQVPLDSDPQRNLQKTLESAIFFDVVVYRIEKNETLEPLKNTLFTQTQFYPSPSGGLYCFWRKQ